MSRSSEAKRARRRKRHAGRDSTWVPDALFGELLAERAQDAEEDAGPDAGPEAVAEALADAVAGVDEMMTGRGWVLDEASIGNDLVSWVYPPSAVESADRSVEPVTRMWIAVHEDDSEVELTFGATLAGSGPADDGPHRLDPDRLADALAALEAYRAGDPPPAQ